MINKERIIELEHKLKNDIKIQSGGNLTVHYQIQKPGFCHIDELQTNPRKQVSFHIRATVIKDGKAVKDESGVILSAKLHLATKKPVSKKEAFEMFGTELYQPEIMELKDNHFNALQDYCQVAAYKNNIRKQREVQKGRDKVELQHGITTHSLAAPIHHVCEQIGEIESVDRVTAFEAESLLQAIFRLEEILRAKGMDEKALHKPLASFSMLNDTIASQVHIKYQVANKSRKNQIEADIFGSLTDEDILNIQEMTHKDHSYPRQELEIRKKRILASSPQAES
ncbi:hypothetical protein AB6E36_14785 [Vibrio cyclitrophicus]